MKYSIYILLLILVIASFLRLYGITEFPPGFFSDEAIYANNGVEAWENRDWKVFYTENNGREGLWPNIIGFFIVNFGNEPWVPRSVAAVFGILTVLGVYFLTKELFLNNIFQEKIALLSVFLLATNFWHINFSRIGFRAIMAPLFLTWGIYFLLKILNKIKYSNNQRVYLLFFAILGGLFYGLGFHSYIAYRGTPLLIFIILLVYWFQSGASWQIRHKILLVASSYTLMAILVALPLGLYFLKNPQDFMGRTTQISIFNSPTLIEDLAFNIVTTAGMFNFVGDFNWRHNIAGQPLLFWPVGILFLIGIFLSLWKFKEYYQSSIILFFLLAITALPVVVSNEGLPHALRAILMAPAILIFAGFGGVWFYQKITAILKDSGKKINIFNFLVELFLIILMLQAYYSYFIVWTKNPNVKSAFNTDITEEAQKLNNLPKDTPKYVLIKASGIDIRAVGTPAQTIMFITDTFTLKKQKEKNIHYILQDQANQIPENSYIVVVN